VVGLLHPGEMGAAIGARLASAGVPVLWAGEGRSPATAARADAAGLAAAADLAALCRRAALILSVCPPAAALEVAGRVAACGFDGLYVDANAVAPATADAVAARCGTTYVDAAIVGGPPLAGSAAATATTVYASGEQAGEVVDLLVSAGLRSVDLGPDPRAASALKMCYAAWTKGAWALLAATAAAARGLGVEDALREEWAHSQPDLARRLERGAGANTPKAWRFAGEMSEIGTTMRAAGLPDGFGLAASDVYERLGAYRAGRHEGPPPTVAEVLDLLLSRPAGDLPGTPLTR
jgi:3-hydroxyisobutyrate dehydrogenase-like beta-hydroxyacid dehydrogenase